MHLLTAAAALACSVNAGGLAWRKHNIPISGELVLTDVHAFYDAATDEVTALATGEGGVVLKLQEPVSQPIGNWTVAMDASYPLYFYGCYVFDANTYLVSGFDDGSGQSFGLITFSEDGGQTWAQDSTIDKTQWGGGPIEFASSSEGYMPSTSGQSAWRTTTGGRNTSSWVEIDPSPGNWHAGNYVYDGNGYIAIAGSSDCNSTDFGTTWACQTPVDQSGLDSAIACDGTFCLVGGGEIDPAVAGWVHVSKDSGNTWSPRALSANFPIRSTAAVSSASAVTLVAAGGNFFSAVGGIYSSTDAGATWTLDINIGQEVKACRGLPIPSLNATRIYCVSAGSTGGSIYSTDIL